MVQAAFRWYHPRMSLISLTARLLPHVFLDRNKRTKLPPPIHLASLMLRYDTLYSMHVLRMHHERSLFSLSNEL
jgi:hypothetical protein